MVEDDSLETMNLDDSNVDFFNDDFDQILKTNPIEPAPIRENSPRTSDPPELQDDDVSALTDLTTMFSWGFSAVKDTAKSTLADVKSTDMYKSARSTTVSAYEQVANSEITKTMKDMAPDLQKLPSVSDIDPSSIREAISETAHGAGEMIAPAYDNTKETVKAVVGDWKPSIKEAGSVMGGWMTSGVDAAVHASIWFQGMGTGIDSDSDEPVQEEMPGPMSVPRPQTMEGGPQGPTPPTEDYMAASFGTKAPVRPVQPGSNRSTPSQRSAPATFSQPVHPQATAPSQPVRPPTAPVSTAPAQPVHQQAIPTAPAQLVRPQATTAPTVPAQTVRTQPTAAPTAPAQPVHPQATAVPSATAQQVRPQAPSAPVQPVRPQAPATSVQPVRPQATTAPAQQMHSQAASMPSPVATGTAQAFRHPGAQQPGPRPPVTTPGAQPVATTTGSPVRSPPSGVPMTGRPTTAPQAAARAPFAGSPLAAVRPPAGVMQPPMTVASPTAPMPTVDPVKKSTLPDVDDLFDF